VRLINILPPKCYNSYLLGWRNKTLSVSARIFAPPKGLAESAPIVKVGDGKVGGNTDVALRGASQVSSKAVWAWD